MSEHIKTCPFCGGKAHESNGIISCNYECASLPPEDWNRRDTSAIEAARQEGYAACCKGVDAFTDATNEEVRDLRRQLAAAQARLLAISEIKDEMFGGDWDEIEKAREIAKSQDTATLDNLLAAQERETVERCAKALEAEAASWGVMQTSGYLGAIIRKGLKAIRDVLTNVNSPGEEVREDESKK